MATSTFYPVAGENTPVDGHVRRLSPVSSGETLSNIRIGSGTTPSDTSSTIGVELRTSTVSSTNQFEDLNRGIVCFDTSSLGDIIILSATISLYAVVKQTFFGDDDIHIAGATPASDNILISSDYAQVQTTSFSSINTSAISLNVYTDFSLNASGINNINTDGVSKFSIQLGWDINNNFTGTWVINTATGLQFRSADNGILAQTPKLTIVHIPKPTLQGISSIQGIQSIQL